MSFARGSGDSLMRAVPERTNGDENAHGNPRDGGGINSLGVLDKPFVVSKLERTFSKDRETGESARR